MIIKKNFRGSVVYMAAVLAFLLGGISNTSNAQIAFSVSPGLGLNSAYVGYNVSPKFMPFVSFQYMGFSTNYTSSYTDWDYDNNVAKNFTYADKVTGSIMLPGIGIKYFLANQNKIKTYATLSVTKPIVSAKYEEDGVVNKEVEDLAKSVSLLGTELGFGAEYFFDDNFSIGGEFGFRMLSGNLEENYDDEYYDPIKDEYVPSKSVYTSKGSLTPTYTKFTLNFYFLRGTK